MNETRDDADESGEEETASIESGDTVYDDQGRVLGIVTEFTEEGFAVAVVEAGASVTGSEDGRSADAEDIPGKDFGEGYLMWRCEDCGEMGDLDDGIPEECPECGAPKEHIHMAQED
jgi:rubrerythrin